VGYAACLLDLGDGMKSQCRLSARLGAVHLDDPPAWIATDAESDIEPDTPGRDGLNALGQACPFLEAHDRAFAVFFLDRRDGKLDRFALILGVIHSFFHSASLTNLYCPCVQVSTLEEPAPS
jgi:hypothetical protein